MLGTEGNHLSLTDTGALCAKLISLVRCMNFCERTAELFFLTRITVLGHLRDSRTERHRRWDDEPGVEDSPGAFIRRRRILSQRIGKTRSQPQILRILFSI